MFSLTGNYGPYTTFCIYILLFLHLILNFDNNEINVEGQAKIDVVKLIKIIALL